MLHRRLIRDYETHQQSSRAMIHWSIIGIMSRTLTHLHAELAGPRPYNHLTGKIPKMPTKHPVRRPCHGVDYEPIAPHEPRPIELTRVGSGVADVLSRDLSSAIGMPVGFATSCQWLLPPGVSGHLDHHRRKCGARDRYRRGRALVADPPVVGELRSSRTFLGDLQHRRPSPPTTGKRGLEKEDSRQMTAGPITPADGSDFSASLGDQVPKGSQNGREYRPHGPSPSKNRPRRQTRS